MTVEELAKRYKVGDHTVTRFASEIGLEIELAKTM